MQGRYPDDCPAGAWHYICPIRCTACYDDLFAAPQIRMRLADPALDWIQGELAARYPGAQPKEGLPRTWQIAGVANRMRYDAWWRYAPAGRMLSPPARWIRHARRQDRGLDDRHAQEQAAGG